MAKTDWFRLLGYVTGSVNQQLLLKNEYLVAENRLLKAGPMSRQMNGSPQVSMQYLGQRCDRLSRRSLIGSEISAPAAGARG